MSSTPNVMQKTKYEDEMGEKCRMYKYVKFTNKFDVYGTLHR
jgi:hypothetical protein